MKKVLGVIVVLVVIGTIIGSHSGNKSGSSSDNGGGAANASGSGSANIKLLAGRSFCLASGIDDAYTGNGHVIFSVMLKNTGTESGSVDVTPVRHYTDGQMNESPMDTMTMTVPAGATRQFKSPEFTYKAHEHEVESCGLIVDGGSEVNVYATSVGAITGNG